MLLQKGTHSFLFFLLSAVHYLVLRLHASDHIVRVRVQARYLTSVSVRVYHLYPAPVLLLLRTFLECLYRLLVLLELLRVPLACDYILTFRCLNFLPLLSRGLLILKHQTSQNSNYHLARVYDSPGVIIFSNSLRRRSSKFVLVSS